MSISLTNAQQIEYDALVHAQFQSKGFKLKNCIRVKSGVVGYRESFRKKGYVVANQTGFQATIPIQDGNFTQVPCDLVKYTAATGTDIIQDLTVNFDSRQELVELGAMGIGRRSDQIIIDAVETSSATNVIAAAATNMSYSKLRQLVEIFEDNAAPIEDRYVAMSGNNLRALLADDKIISRFYTSNDAVVKGNLQYAEIVGCNFIVLPKMVEGGLVKVGNERHALAWQKTAVGYAIGQDLRTEINYLAREMTWFINSAFYAGAVGIDTLGIVRIVCDESVNPA